NTRTPTRATLRTRECCRPPTARVFPCPRRSPHSSASSATPRVLHNSCRYFPGARAVEIPARIRGECASIRHSDNNGRRLRWAYSSRDKRLATGDFANDFVGHIVRNNHSSIFNLCHSFEKARVRFHRAKIIWQIKMLVRSVCAVVGETKPHHHHLRAQFADELVRDRNAPAEQLKDRRDAERFLQSVCRRAHIRRIAIQEHGFARRELFEFPTDGVRRVGAQVFFQLLFHFFRALIGHEAQREFRHRFGGQDRFGTLARKTGKQSVDFERGTRADAFGDGETRFSPQLLHPRRVCPLRVGDGKTRQRGAFVRVQYAHVVIESRQRHASLRVMHSCD